MGNELFLKCNLVFASTCLCMNWNSLSHSDSLEPHGQYISWILQAIILEWVSDTWNKFSCSVMSDSLRPSCTAAHQASLSITKSQSLLKLISIESVMPSNHLILCCPLLLLPSILPSIEVFSNDSVLCIKWPEYWSFCFSISRSKEHTGLICFPMDCLDLIAVQGTLQSFFYNTTVQKHQYFSAQLPL